MNESHGKRRGHPTFYDERYKKMFITLFENDFTLKQISEMLGPSIAQLQRWKKEHLRASHPNGIRRSTDDP